MEIIEVATMTSKGQVTVPVIFKVTDKGVFFMPCEIKEKDAYTREEWGKIECLVAERGKSYETAKGARKHLKSL
jgi:hypothetical protein